MNSLSDWGTELQHTAPPCMPGAYEAVRGAVHVLFADTAMVIVYAHTSTLMNFITRSYIIVLTDFY